MMHNLKCDALWGYGIMITLTHFGFIQRFKANQSLATCQDFGTIAHPISTFSYFPISIDMSVVPKMGPGTLQK